MDVPAVKEFIKVFYVNFGYPDNHFTRGILEQYLRCGAKAFLFDLPSFAPYLETDAIQKNMAYVLQHQGIKGVMAGISEFRSLHRDITISMIVYTDSIVKVGTGVFTQWCGENGIRHVSLISRERDGDMLSQMIQGGIIPTISAEYSLDAAKQTGVRGDELVTIQFGKKGTAYRESFAQRLQAVRAAVLGNPVWAEMGISTAEDVREIKVCGADGAIIGSAAMALWDDPTELCAYLKTICEV